MASISTSCATGRQSRQRSVSLNQPDRAFKIEAFDNQQIGAVFSQDNRQRQRRRHREFNVQDLSGQVIARIDKTRAGLAKELLAKGDDYVVSFQGVVVDLLRTLSVAATIVIDTSFHQQ